MARRALAEKKKHNAPTYEIKKRIAKLETRLAES
jgi:hypothetical protein